MYTLEDNYDKNVLKTISLLARGIQDFDQQYKEERLENLPSLWKKASAKLHLIGLEQGLKQNDLFPLTLDKQMEWLSTPLTAWPYPKFAELFSLEDDFMEPILYDFSVTEFCIAIAQEGQNPILEQDTEEFVQLKTLLDDTGYRYLRKFLIDNPVVRVTDRKVLKQMKNLPNEVQSKLWDLFYEPIPLTYVSDKTVNVCPRCSWTLFKDLNGDYKCDTDKCKKLTRNWEEKVRSIENGSNLLRVKRGIRRYIVDPGIIEMNLYKELCKIGKDNGQFEVELYPNKDEYDISIKLKNGETWMIDVKDWAVPQQLAFHIKPFSSTSEYAKAFLIVPNYRGEKYVEKLKVICDKGYIIMTDKEIIHYIMRMIEEE